MKISDLIEYSSLISTEFDLFHNELHKLDYYLDSVITPQGIYYDISRVKKVSIKDIDSCKILISTIIEIIATNSRIDSNLDNIYLMDSSFKFIFGVFDEQSFVEQIKSICNTLIKNKYRKKLGKVNTIVDLDHILHKTKYF